MGRFFSNVQMKNEQESREAFTKAFCTAMEKHGMMPATEKDATHTYLLAFSETGSWVTLCTDDYNGDNDIPNRDAAFFSESLHTACICVAVVDSDYAILELHRGACTDQITVGDTSEYGSEEGSANEGDADCWSPLLAEHTTWAQFLGACSKPDVFVEDTLADIASLLDMDPQAIIMDHHDLRSRTDKNVIELHFKRKGGKALTLDAAFKQVFGEALAPLGFKKIKGRQPYFVRVVPGGEIIHIITYRNEDPDRINKKSFSILGGVATVYRDKIDLAEKPKDNIWWLCSNLEFYRKYNPFDPVDIDRETFKKLYRFSYIMDDEESLCCEVKRSLEATKQYMMPIFNDAIDIDACLRYFLKMGLVRNLADRFESLLFLKTDHYAQLLLENLNRKRSIYEHNVKMNVHGYTQEELDRRRQRYNEVNEHVMEPIKEVLANPALHAEYIEKLEQHKAANIEMLKSFGINI